MLKQPDKGSWTAGTGLTYQDDELQVINLRFEALQLQAGLEPNWWMNHPQKTMETLKVAAY